MDRRELGRTGLVVSKLGFGAATLGGEYGPIDEAEGHRSVRAAIDLGINFFDVAPYYGRTRAETVLGEALDGVRDRVVLATKVGRYGKADFDFRPATVLSGLDASLQRLRTDRVDLIYVHDIEFGDLDRIIDETLPALERARAQGKVGAIGVSGLPLSTLLAAVERGRLDVVLSYCHYTLADTTFEFGLAPAATARGVGLVNASPLGMGLLTPAGPPDWHPALAILKAACREAAVHCNARGADLADLGLRFALRAPFVASTLVGMSTVAEVERNVRAASGEIDTELLGEVESILRPVAGMTWPSGIAAVPPPAG